MGSGARDFGLLHPLAQHIQCCKHCPGIQHVQAAPGNRAQKGQLILCRLHCGCGTHAGVLDQTGRLLRGHPDVIGGLLRWRQEPATVRDGTGQRLDRAQRSPRQVDVRQAIGGAPDGNQQTVFARRQVDLAGSDQQGPLQINLCFSYRRGQGELLGPDGKWQDQTGRDE